MMEECAGIKLNKLDTSISVWVELKHKIKFKNKI